MKKILFLLIPFCLPAIALSVWLFYDQRQPPAWQAELEKYIASQEHGTSMRITQQAVDRATKPWKFTRAPGFIIYGDTPYYVTDQTYDLVGVEGLSRMPLPFPPVELWCVLLRLESVYPYGAPRLQMAFIGRHQDLYNAGWVIHLAIQPAESAELAQTLADVGCDIDVSKPIRNLLGSINQSAD